MRKIFLSCLSLILVILLNSSCQKDNASLGALYTPTAADVTATATLQELQQGRSLLINNCERCHGLYSPDTYTPTDWKMILQNMVPRTGLTNANATLVTKYVCRGKQ
jgi:hypothetical protein